MNINLNKYRNTRGAIFFWLLVFIIVVVVAFVIVSIIHISKKVEKFKPRYDDVSAIMEAELAPYKEQYPNGEVIAMEPELLSSVALYFITKTTNWVDWERVFETTDQDEFNNWTMPPPDLSVPFIFYNRQVIITNQ